eukprot:GAHX01002681.1.p1 GENE.GAHX01002681.1~~GAHX01002681.1.p1  ORF type:complete len:282 (-),score=36.08 GAHX01002681.1:135-980(-)
MSNKIQKFVSFLVLFHSLFIHTIPGDECNKDECIISGIYFRYTKGVEANTKVFSLYFTPQSFANIQIDSKTKNNESFKIKLGKCATANYNVKPGDTLYFDDKSQVSVAIDRSITTETNLKLRHLLVYSSDLTETLDLLNDLFKDLNMYPTIKTSNCNDVHAIIESFSDTSVKFLFSIKSVDDHFKDAFNVEMDVEDGKPILNKNTEVYFSYTKVDIGYKSNRLGEFIYEKIKSSGNTWKIVLYVSLVVFIIILITFIKYWHKQRKIKKNKKNKNINNNNKW